MLSFATALPSLTLALSAVATYQWPDKRYEELEHMLIDNTGTNDAGFAVAVTPCTRYISSPLTNTGRETAAQWQRVFFHDVSTGNIFNGQGGLDASIGFETTRPENKGAAMNDTLTWHSYFYNQHVSMADLIALGVVVSTVSCSGPVIDYKAGRIDALAGGASGVPEPDISAQDYFATMANLGLSSKESIQFLACGHTIGSVHHSGFPEILGPEYVSSTNTNGGCPFDATVDGFDNSVVQQYLAGTSQDALVTSYNVTNRADLRIFSADGNATMQDLAQSNTYFQGVCRNVYSKALNVVPKNVQLFDVTPISVKPVNVTLDVSLLGAVTFKGMIRLLGTQFPASSASSRTVIVVWTGSDNKEYTAKASGPQYGESLYLNTTNTYYSFSGPVSSAGVQSFVIRVTQNGRTTTYDNNGKRFAFADGVAWLPELSNFFVNATSNILHGVVAAAVHTSVNPSLVTATLNIPVPQVGAMNPTIQSSVVHLTRTLPLGNNYWLYATIPAELLQLQTGTNITTRAPALAAQGSLDITATISGKPITDSFRKISEVGITLL